MTAVRSLSSTNGWTHPLGQLAQEVTPPLEYHALGHDAHVSSPSLLLTPAPHALTELVGDAVGDTDGLSVGLTLGDAVGELEGDTVGERVGDAVGLAPTVHRGVGLAHVAMHEGAASLGKKKKWRRRRAKGVRMRRDGLKPSGSKCSSKRRGGSRCRVLSKAGQ
jgi:hypothetical protein